MDTGFDHKFYILGVVIVLTFFWLIKRSGRKRFGHYHFLCNDKKLLEINSDHGGIELEVYDMKSGDTIHDTYLSGYELFFSKGLPFARHLNDAPENIFEKVLKDPQFAVSDIKPKRVKIKRNNK
jgi:hypothetical protein